MSKTVLRSPVVKERVMLWASVKEHPHVQAAFRVESMPGGSLGIAVERGSLKTVRDLLEL
jgi:hypothetical protein